MTQNVKRKAAGLANWTAIDENYAWTRFSLQLQGWSAPREFFAIRERIRETKSAVGRRLIDVDGYTFRAFFTYNLLSLYQHASSPEQRKTGFKRPVTLRAEVFIGGAVLGTRSRTPVL